MGTKVLTPRRQGAEERKEEQQEALFLLLFFAFLCAFAPWRQNPCTHVVLMPALG